MEERLKKLGRFILTQLKKIALAIPVAVLLVVLYVQCTKIGSDLMLETSGIKWYVSDDGATKDDIQAISDIVNKTLSDKGIDPSDFDVNLILCNSTNEFLWKALVWDANNQGITRHLFDNIVINKSSIKENKMEGFENSSLSDVVIHELCHIYLSKRLSQWDAYFMESWKNEGFCEYIAEHSTIGVENGLSLFLANDKSEIEKTDHIKTLYFYFTSRLKTDYLLGHKRVPFEEFVNTEYDEEALESEIRKDLMNEEYEYMP